MAAQQLVRRPIQPVAQAAVRAAATSGAIRPVKSKPGVLWDPDRQKFFKLVDTLVHGQYDTALVFAAIFTLIAMALGLYGAVVLIENRLLAWQRDPNK